MLSPFTSQRRGTTLNSFSSSNGEVGTAYLEEGGAVDTDEHNDTRRFQPVRQPSIVIKFTGYRILSLLSITGFGTGKAVASFRNKSIISNTLDWVLGVAIALVIALLGYIPEDHANAWPRFYRTNYGPSILRLTRRAVIHPLRFLIKVVCFAIRFLCSMCIFLIFMAFLLAAVYIIPVPLYLAFHDKRYWPGALGIVACLFLNALSLLCLVFLYPFKCSPHCTKWNPLQYTAPFLLWQLVHYIVYLGMLVKFGLGRSRSANSGPHLPMTSDAETRSEEEIDALLAQSCDHLAGAAVRGNERAQGFGESFDDVPKTKRQLGMTSAVFLVSNRIIGTGIFATPSIILRAAGSVGFSLLMWVIGAMVAGAGTAVYLELGTVGPVILYEPKSMGVLTGLLKGLPRSGGEKVYLEFIYRRPKYLMSCIYAALAVFMAAAGGGAVVFAEYLLRAFALRPTFLNTRLVATLVLTFALFMHSAFMKWGVRLQNFLGILGLLNLTAVAVTGLLVAVGIISLHDNRPLPHNFDHVWEGTRLEANAIVTGLFSIIWSYIGYSNANYALSEIKDPIRTIKKAAPIALSTVTIIYIFVNISYFVVVDKEEIRQSGQGVAALFFRNVYGSEAERVLDLLISLSVLGNVMAVVFASGRIMQELGREDIVPFASVFASNRPFNAPFSALAQQCLFSALSVILPPPGDAYAFVLNFSSYPYTIINTLIALGLLGLRIPSVRTRYEWEPPFHAWGAAVVFFFLSNVFLMVVPFVPPSTGEGPYENLPYWLHSTAVAGVVIIGVLYWLVVFRWMPKWRGYTLVRVHVKAEDGVSRTKFRKVDI